MTKKTNNTEDEIGEIKVISDLLPSPNDLVKKDGIINYRKDG